MEVLIDLFLPFVSLTKWMQSIVCSDMVLLQQIPKGMLHSSTKVSFSKFVQDVWYIKALVRI